MTRQLNYLFFHNWLHYYKFLFWFPIWCQEKLTTTRNFNFNIIYNPYNLFPSMSFPGSEGRFSYWLPFPMTDSCDLSMLKSDLPVPGVMHITFDSLWRQNWLGMKTGRWGFYLRSATCQVATSKCQALKKCPSPGEVSTISQSSQRLSALGRCLYHGNAAELMHGLGVHSEERQKRFCIV